MAEKERLDFLLVEKNLVKSRELAKALIMAGKVFVGNEKVLKAGTKIDVDSDILVKDNKMKYVSRGGYKLEKAILEFSIDLNDKICIDVGASTGGFTDCMLQNGAKKVYSIDVGRGEFHWNLRTDERVCCLEKTNIRYVDNTIVPDLCDFASIDVSFISLSKVLPPTVNLLNENGCLVCLIKPQFEAGRDKVGKKGVVRDKNVHLEVITNVVSFALSINLNVLNISFSPIKGPAGNIEFLIYLSKSEKGLDSEQIEKLIDEVVLNSSSLNE